MKDVEKMIEVMKNHMNGGKTKSKTKTGRWTEIANPSWNWAEIDFRINSWAGVDPTDENLKMMT